jgi:hypothetical protein
MSVQERVAKLEALLARVSKRARDPRLPSTRGDEALVSEGGDSAGRQDAAPPVDRLVSEAAEASEAAPPAEAHEAAERVEAGEAEEFAQAPESAELTEHTEVPQVAELEVTHESMAPLPIEVEILATEVELEEHEALGAPEAGPADASPPQELPSRERMVAVSPAQTAEPEALEKEVESGAPEELASEGAGAAVSDVAKVEEPPASSRRPIALEPKLEDLAFDEASPSSEEPHSAPPESGRQVAAAPGGLDFEGESTGVRPKEVEPVYAREAKPPEEPPSLAAETTQALAAQQPDQALEPQEPLAPPLHAPSTQIVDANVPEVTVARPAAQQSDQPVAVFAGAAPVFKPLTFGELLDATLSL